LPDHSNRPKKHDECEPDGGPDALHHDVGGNLCCNVEGEQNGEAVIVLEAIEVEVAFEVVEAGVADVGAVEEA
jgi:hypothetical protein